MFSGGKERVHSEQMGKLKIPFELLYHLIINLKYAYMAEYFSNVISSMAQVFTEGVERFFAIYYFHENFQNIL